MKKKGNLLPRTSLKYLHNKNKGRKKNEEGGVARTERSAEEDIIYMAIDSDKTGRNE